MKTSKILSSTFTQPWGSGANLTYYHSVVLEGEPKPYTIGAKQQNPAWLTAGLSIDWEFKNEAQGSIKKAQKPFGGQAAQTQAQTVVVPPADPTELRISTGLISATILYSAGKISKDQINDIAANVARKFDEIKAAL